MNNYNINSINDLNLSSENGDVVINNNCLLKRDVTIGTMGGDDGSSFYEGSRIYFSSGHGDTNVNFAVLERREFSEAEQHEMLLFSGNDFHDRIRLNAGEIRFDTFSTSNNDRTTVNTKMILTKNGDLGVGVLTPSEKVEVNGNILCDESQAEHFKTIAEEVELSVSGVIEILPANKGLYILTNTATTGTYKAALPTPQVGDKCVVISNPSSSATIELVSPNNTSTVFSSTSAMRAVLECYTAGTWREIESALLSTYSSHI